MGEKIFGCPVRTGMPRYISNMEEFEKLKDPVYSTVTGLARYGAIGRAKREGWGLDNLGAFSKFAGRIRNWVRTNLR